MASASLRPCVVLWTSAASLLILNEPMEAVDCTYLIQVSFSFSYEMEFTATYSESVFADLREQGSAKKIREGNGSICLILPLASFPISWDLSSVL